MLLIVSAYDPDDDTDDDGEDGATRYALTSLPCPSRPTPRGRPLSMNLGGRVGRRDEPPERPRVRLLGLKVDIYSAASAILWHFITYEWCFPVLLRWRFVLESALVVSER